jgi:hypothetical protein
VREHVVVPSIHSREVACAQRSGVRHGEDALKVLDLGDDSPLGWGSWQTLIAAFLYFRGEELHGTNCEAVRVESLKVREQNDGQVSIDEMSIFDHPGTDMKNHAVTVEYVRVPPSCELGVTPVV